MAETVGSLVDKLTVMNIRIWHAIDRQDNPSLTLEQRFAAAQMVKAANSQRNALIDELDKLLGELIQSGKGRVQDKLKLY